MSTPAVERISDVVWEIPISYKKGMRVPARINGTNITGLNSSFSLQARLTGETIDVTRHRLRVDCQSGDPSPVPSGKDQ